MHRLFNWLLGCSLALVASGAMAEFHTFQIEQMFSSADGTIQFVVLQESAGMNGENMLGGHAFTSMGGATQTYTFNVDLPGGSCGYYGCAASPTAHAHVLIATQGFADLGLITPDYVIPNGFLPLTNGTINYAGVDQVSYAALPTDGVSALNRSGMSVPNLAMNFARQSVSVTAPAPAFDLDQHGLTGSWYNAATSGQGVEVEVYPDLSAPGTGFAQVSWFTYDTAAGLADHERWYTASGAVTSGQPNAALTIYQNTDGNFNAGPMTTAQAVGTATLSFTTCTSGQLSYNFTDGTGRTGSIPLTRLTQNVTCATTTPFPTNTDFAHSGNWFDSATAGQGFTVEVNPTSGALFAAWYTYEPMGAMAGAAGQRWYTAQATFTAGMRSIPVTIYATTGGIFNTPPPAGQQTVAVGTGTLAFQSCTAATFSYNFTAGSSSGLSGTITLSRVGAVPPGCTS
jgi:hypothetical protein